MGAHRVSWQLHHGPIPDGLWVLHHCDVGHCVRPDHLYLGTHAENVRDALKRKRFAQGEKHYSQRDPRLVNNHRFTEDQVREMRTAWGNGESQTSIARRYEADQGNVRRILIRKTYAWVG